MGRKRPASADQPRPSPALDALREALGLEGADWEEYLRHARDGLADYERGNRHVPKSTFRLRDVPPKWWEDPEAWGYVALRVLTEGEADLVIPVARHFLRVGLPEPFSFLGPPGLGLAWLQLARHGVEPPVDPARLIHRALHEPKRFFQGVPEHDLLPLGRLILEGLGAIESWDMNVLILAVHRAGISVGTPFRLFNELMAADWIPPAVKRQFCRELLACSPEADRLRERGEALERSLRAEPHLVFETPLMRLELCRGGLRLILPVLQRHAVRALAEDAGEPLRDVLAQFFPRPDQNKLGADAVTQGVLDLVELHAEELGPDDGRSLLSEAVKASSGVVRQAAYRVGAEQFGPDFARPALKDNARLVRDWAAKLLARDAGKPGRKATPGRRPAPSDD